MAQVMEVLQAQIVPVMLVFGAYFLAQVANTLLGIGIATQSEITFDWKVLAKGVVKGLIVAVGSIVLILSFNLVGFLVSQGFDVEGFDTIVNVTMIIATLGVATIAKIAEAFKKLIAYSGLQTQIESLVAKK